MDLLTQLPPPWLLEEPEYSSSEMQEIKLEPTDDTVEEVSMYVSDRTASPQPVSAYSPNGEYINLGYEPNFAMTAISNAMPEEAYKFEPSQQRLFAKMTPVSTSIFDTSSLSNLNGLRDPSSTFQLGLFSSDEGRYSYVPTALNYKCEPENSPTSVQDPSSSSSSSSPAPQWLSHTKFSDTSPYLINKKPMNNGIRQNEYLSHQVSGEECVKCGTRNTSCWFKDPTGHFLCTTCEYKGDAMFKGPKTVRASKGQKRSLAKKTNQSCTNCSTTMTSLWRRYPSGEPVCNACGLYRKLHGSHRPLTMKKDSIQTRKRKPKAEKKKSVDHSPPLTPVFQENGISVGSNPSSSAAAAASDYQLYNVYHQNFAVVPDEVPVCSTSSYQRLPPVHSPEGFPNPLSSYGSSSSSPSPPVLTSLLASQPYIHDIDNIQSHSITPLFPTRATTLQNGFAS